MVYNIYQNEAKGNEANEPERIVIESLLRAAFYAGVGLGVLAGKALADFLKKNL